MTKIYEALMNAQKEKAVVKPLSVVIPKDKATLHLPAENIIETLNRLNHSIEALLPNLNNKVIQFVGSRDCEGSSILIREFAKVSALKYSKSVLLVDTEPELPNQRKYFNINPKTGLEDMVADSESLREDVSKIGQSELYVGHVGSGSNNSFPSNNSSRIEKVVETIRKNFDLVLLDSPAVARYPDSLMLSSKVDGVVLVVEAEKTRWQVATKVKEKINGSGGKLLGVVLNKRKHHIPKRIYKIISGD